MRKVFRWKAVSCPDCENFELAGVAGTEAESEYHEPVPFVDCPNCGAKLDRQEGDDE